MLVRLTEKGETLFDQVAPLHLANEERLLSALLPEQREQLASLLRVLLLSFEKAAPDDAQDPGQRIGASLAPACVARQVRRSVGLPDPPGLLVQNVKVPGPAAKAGLQVGDLIVAANDVETPSITSLYEQLAASNEDEPWFWTSCAAQNASRLNSRHWKPWGAGADKANSRVVHGAACLASLFVLARSVLVHLPGRPPNQAASEGTITLRSTYDPQFVLCCS